MRCDNTSKSFCHSCSHSQYLGILAVMDHILRLLVISASPPCSCSYWALLHSSQKSNPHSVLVGKSQLPNVPQRQLLGRYLHPLWKQAAPPCLKQVNKNTSPPCTNFARHRTRPSTEACYPLHVTGNTKYGAPGRQGVPDPPTPLPRLLPQFTSCNGLNKL